MGSIALGRSDDGRAIGLDLDVLVRTRLLVQANSGGGKSWLLRRLAEQCFGEVPVLLIDPEGEFATLREKYGYVLVGKGGETPADPRSAALVATKLLELNASAVCDLYELKPFDRHRWVRLFLEALIDAPKKLWHPTIVVVDEAHKFCPEKGAGESEAADAMIGLATQGRKRGFAAVYATQRLGKLRKDAAAELLNVMIGQTFIDIDRKRAADALGVAPADHHGFFHEIKVIAPGNFYAVGRAISLERIRLHVGPVRTTHPEAGSGPATAGPPPAPEKVKRLLPKLADLPREAEEKARTEAELRVEIRALKAAMAEAKRAAPPPAPAQKTRIVDRLVLSRGQLRELDRALVRSEKLAAGLEGVKTLARVASEAFAANVERLRASISAVKAAASTTGTDRRPIHKVIADIGASVPAKAWNRVPPAAARAGFEVGTAAVAAANGKITRSQQGVLDALAWLESVRVVEPERTQLALLSGKRPTSGGYKNDLGKLRTEGLLVYPQPGTVRLTERGRDQARPPDAAPTTADLHRSLEAKLPRSKWEILRRVIDAPDVTFTREELAEKILRPATSGGFKNDLGSLHSMGLVDYPSPGAVRAARILFLETP